MKSIISFILFLVTMFIYTGILFAQAPDTLWTRTYGVHYREVANGVAELPGGGFMVGGYTNDSTGNSDVWLFRTDAGGNMVWEDIIGYPDLVEVAYTLEPALDGTFILAGMKEDESENTGSGYIVKADSNGIGWGFTYGAAGEYTYLYDAVGTIYNEVVGVGHQTNDQAGADVYEVGTFPSGIFKWNNWLDWGQYEYARSIARTSDGGFIVAGDSYSSGTSVIFLHKLDSLGFQTGLISYDFIPKLYARSVQQTLDGGYIVVGYHVYVSSPTRDVMVIKTDSSGALEWWKQYDGGANRNDYASDVVVLPDGGYIVVGQGAATIYDWDIWLFRLDANGDTLWNKFIGEQHLAENAYQIRALSDGGYIIAGAKEVTGGRSAAYLVRLGPEPVGIKHNNTNPPEEFALYQNYPNPFNPSTTIKFDLPETGFVKLKIFNILGQEVAALVSQRLPAGSHSYTWESLNLAGGLYLCHLQSGDYVETRKMILMR